MGTNVAVTAAEEVTRTVQGPVPEHAAPLQPANADPGLGVAVRVTEVPESNAAEQVRPQLMPAGALVTVPLPAPDKLTETLYCGVGGGPKFATTDWSEFIVTEQAPVPLHAPPHPVKANPGAGVTVRVTAVP